MIEIPLSQGFVALLDDEHERVVAPFRWYALNVSRTDHPRWYAVTKTPGRGGATIYMHRHLLAVTDRSQRVDHRNGDSLDNRRANLRLSTAGQNAQNQRRARGRTSRFKGVSWVPSRNQWIVQLSVDHRRISARFDNEVEAARAYDDLAREHFGEFAATNADLGLFEEETTCP